MIRTELAAPQIDHYIRWLRDATSPFDKASLALIDTLYHELGKIVSCGDDNRRELWLCAERGTIEDFGDYEEMLAGGEIENREEWEDWWRSEYPEEKVWYHFVAVEYNDFRAVIVQHQPVIQINPHEKSSWGHDVTPFIKWMIQSVKNCIAGLQANTYNETLSLELPPQHRTGTILRSDYWDIFPEYRQEYLSGISSEDIQDFLKYMLIQEQTEKPKLRIPRLTAGMFYEYCSLGYQANRYDGCNTLSPKEQYYKNADGRDEGLRHIHEDSPEAFHNWLHNREGSGHPWEVCRGGNATHISLYVQEDENGFYLIVTGKSYGRSIEAIKFYLALAHNNIPVWMNDGGALAARLTARDKIGIVPKGVMPCYCESYFPNEYILDFIKLPEEKREQVAASAVWQPIQKQKLHC